MRRALNVREHIQSGLIGNDGPRILHLSGVPKAWNLILGIPHGSLYRDCLPRFVWLRREPLLDAEQHAEVADLVIAISHSDLKGIELMLAATKIAAKRGVPWIHLAVRPKRGVTQSALDHLGEIRKLSGGVHVQRPDVACLVQPCSKFVKQQLAGLRGEPC